MAARFQYPVPVPVSDEFCGQPLDDVAAAEDDQYHLGAPVHQVADEGCYEPKILEEWTMAENSIHDVRQVREIEGCPERVSAYPAEGWILLHVYSNSIASDHGPSEIPVYVLGWPFKADPQG